MIKPLIQSGSIILVNQYQQILMVKRTANISFSNLHAFPGGVSDIIDKSCSDSFQQYAKITAIRQLFEQVGLIVLPSQQYSSEILKLQEDKVSTKLIQIWKNNLKQLIPVIRLLTIQQVKTKRVDCIFYSNSQKVKVINYMGYHKLSLNPNELHKLVIDNNESLTYQWNTAQVYLQKYKRAQINLLFPQILILNSFKKITNQQILKMIDNKAAVQPLMFKFIPQISCCLILGDQDYNFEKMIEKEPQSQSKQDIISSYKRRKKCQNEKIQRRICIKQGSFYIKSQIMEKSLLCFLDPQPSL